MQPAISVSAADLPLQSLYRWESTQPQHIYLTQPCPDGTVMEISWGDAANQVRRMAAWLQTQNWPEGSKIAIFGKNSAHWILADLAIWMAGMVSVPIYPTFNAETLHYILEHSEAKACFIGKLDDTRNLHVGIPAGTCLITLPLAPTMEGFQWEQIVSSTEPLPDSPIMEADNVCTIIYTSGTTGKPKGVVHTYYSMAWSLSSAMERLPLLNADRLFSYLPLAHVAERMLVQLGSLRYGAQVFFSDSLDSFLHDVRRAQPTVFFSVPRLWVKFQQRIHQRIPPGLLQLLLHIPLLSRIVQRLLLKQLGLSQCRFAAGGAAPMPAPVLRWYRRLGLNLIEAYGMTENCGASHSTFPHSDATGTVGPPYHDIECRIDPQNHEIQIRSPGVMQAYYKDPEQTASAITPDGWLRTGDKGQVNDEGFLTINGRIKDLFKTSKGRYIAPSPIEDILVLHPDIEACAVMGANFAQPFALVMLTPNAVERSKSPEGKNKLQLLLRIHLKSVNEKLEPHEKLAFLFAMHTPWTPENDFVTPTLKVKRQTIENAFHDQFDQWLQLGQPIVWESSLAP
jgi:long-chain acyl-CoA synthetase